MRALKRLKEQLKHWREACGCGFDPSLLSDVARQALNDLRRGGGAGAKIEHILPHLDSSASITTTTGGGGGGGGASGAGSRATSPDLFGGKQVPRLSQDPAVAPQQPAAEATPPAAAATRISPPPPETTSGSALGSGGAAGGGGGAMLSIANPSLVASSAAAPMSASKLSGGGVQSFRGRGGAFGMLLHKVQTTQSSAGGSVSGSGMGGGVAVGPGSDGAGVVEDDGGSSVSGGVPP
ncbi:unnamed protein product [Ectocarpus sp. CCAP 1310/34]|nr:unnamed protein product [Ectocarpus sp. CCAP 1310/34]